MCLSLFLLWLVSIPFSVHALPDAQGVAINCGASEEITEEGIRWIVDEGMINVGQKTTLDTPHLMPILTTLRHFSEESSKKYCYEIPAIKGEKYLVRTTYYYGGYDGGKIPPVFDQIIDGIKWSVVNTTEDYAKGLSSYYEIIVAATTGKLSVCLARNEYTMSAPFISALEVNTLTKTLYNTTDFKKNALSTIARNNFGNVSELLRFPDDPFNRYWQPFVDVKDMPVNSKENVTRTKFWNLPPELVFATGVTASRGKTLDLDWPPMSLPSGNYYIALYFQDNRTPSPYSWRVFDVLINGKTFYKDLNVSTDGVTVFAPQWPLSGMTKLSLVPDDKAMVGPIINAGEILQVVPLGKRTVARDVKAMEKVSRSLKNPPPDWRGDPCMPKEYAWTGVTCVQGKYAAITALNLTGLGLSGELSPSINKLTALTSLWVGENKLTGPIPDMGRLSKLASLHLEDNQFTGQIPVSLGNLRSLHELSIQKNNLDGQVPETLKNKPGLTIES
ncbi:hypothetical protein ACHQM5_024013 [Ranunculus cassubicifolius]